MKKSCPLFAVILTLMFGAIRTHAGTISYVAIPNGQSEANCGISNTHGYTSAVDAGNTRGTDRVINGITLYALTGSGQNTATADNCTVNALSGTLADGGLTKTSIQADGNVREVMSDMSFNNAGGDNSQIEVVLDPESLEQGSTYDLRVYICSSSGQNRQVNLAFFGDGQNASETGFFNEDDARTSAGRFPSANQVYYINYRYIWDGDSTPGITITQKSGGAPFCLYALTNELVSEGEGGAAGEETAAAAGGGGGGVAAGGGGGGAEGQGGDEGLTSGSVDEESDQVGVESDDFYNSDSLNSNGRWIKLSKWGTCWQPTNVPSGWSPYTNGNFSECEDCGWTFVSDEPWAWATYHYGRWCKVRTGCGWAWVPGKTWAASWVSWRRGRDESSCSCIGWAPLPPEAGCEWGVGVSSWVDETCDIGPEAYTFINIRDFGSDSYSGCGCLYDRGRNSTLIIDTFNCTNIWHGRGGTYCGGPDFNWCNSQIRKLGGKECGKVYVNRYDNPGKLGGKFAKHEGNQLGLVSPRIKGEKNPQHRPKTTENVGANKIDHGWNGVNKKQQGELRNHIAKENNGKNPKNSPAQLTGDAAQKLGKHHGGGQNAQAAGQQGGKGKGQGQGAGAGTLHPGGGKGKGQGAGLQGGGAGQGQAQGGVNQHPGKGKRQGTGQGGAANAAAGGTGQGGGFNQHPGKGKNRGAGQGGNAGGGAGANALQGGNQQAGGTRGARHPGQSLKKQGGGQAGGAGAGKGNAGVAGAGGQGAQGGGQHPGKHKGGRTQGAGQAGNQQAGAGAQQGTAQQGTGAKGQGGTGRGKGRGQGQTGQGGAAGAQGGTQGQGTGTAAGGGQGRGKHKQGTQQQQLQSGGQAAGSGQAAGAGSGQGRGRHKQGGQQQQQTQAGGQAAGAGQPAGAGGGGQGRGRQKQGGQQQQQVQGGGQPAAGAGQGRGRRQQQAQQPQGQAAGGQARGRQQVQQQQQVQPRPQGGGGGGAGRGAGGGGGGGGRRPRPTPTPH
ncbi:MAG: hypothetical protein QOG67_1803 [Verrucomicrobiota bacterium]